MPVNGNTFGQQASTVYLKKEATFDPYQWGGCCMRIGDISESLGGQSITYKQKATGGIARDAVRDDVPGDITTEIVMKIQQYSRMKGDLTKCRWMIDKRTHCGQLDNPNAWLEIRRIYYAKVSDRVDTGSTWEADADALSTHSIVGLEVYDIYPVSGAPFVFGA